MTVCVPVTNFVLPVEQQGWIQFSGGGAERLEHKNLAGYKTENLF